MLIEIILGILCTLIIWCYNILKRSKKVFKLKLQIMGHVYRLALNEIEMDFKNYSAEKWENLINTFDQTKMTFQFWIPIEDFKKQFNERMDELNCPNLK